MASVVQIAPPDAIRRIQRVQTVTIAWMSVEALVSLFAAWRARSPALLAFGGDSAIELFSAVVVLWRFRATAAHGDAERRAARVAGALLFALAAYVAITSVASLLGYSEPKPTLLGIAILVAAAVVMPWLAKEKRRLSGATGSAALRADAAQSALCAYLSLIALAGLAITVMLARKVGGPNCGFSGSAAHRLGGSGSHARKGLRLLLDSTTLGIDRSVSCQTQRTTVSVRGSTRLTGLG
jgi:divalent metal cation (Fe/Co/Zn/Cd) transporter